MGWWLMERSGQCFINHCPLCSDIRTTACTGLLSPRMHFEACMRPSCLLGSFCYTAAWRRHGNTMPAIVNGITQSVNSAAICGCYWCFSLFYEHLSLFICWPSSQPPFFFTFFWCSIPPVPSNSLIVCCAASHHLTDALPSAIRKNLQDLFFFFVVIYHVTSAHPWSKCSVILLCSFLTSPRPDCWYFFRPPLSSQGIIKINQEACSFITGHNAHGVFGTHWLAIGSTCPFVRRPGTFRALQCSTSICPQLGATLGRY